MVDNKADKIPIPSEFPTALRCMEIAIPDGDEYVNMLFRALGWLASWTTYERDMTDNGTKTALLWKAAIMASLPESACMNGVEDVRQKDGQPCILEKKLSGEWQPFANLRYCPPNLRVSGGTIQYYDENTETWVDYPGAIGTQPTSYDDGENPTPDGECRSTELAVQGNAAALVPFRVLPGDTVRLTYLSGAWTNNLGVVAAIWSCGNGKIYAFGQCGTNDDSDIGAIITGIPATRVICQYGEEFFDCLNEPFTIPDEWSEELLMVRMNDAEIADNAGSIYVSIEVCNPEAVSNVCGYGTTSLQNWIEYSYDDGYSESTYSTDTTWASDHAIELAGNGARWFKVTYAEPECLRACAFQVRVWDSDNVFVDITYADDTTHRVTVSISQWNWDSGKQWTGALFTEDSGAGSRLIKEVLFTADNGGVMFCPVTFQKEPTP